MISLNELDMESNNDEPGFFSVNYAAMQNMPQTLLAVMMMFICLHPAFSQTATDSTQTNDSTLLGLPGDNLSLAAVLDLFQKSKTIESFEKSLNEEKTGINNLDLNLDQKVDFIKVVTKQKDSSFSFILQVDVSEKEKQDVAVILLDKDKKGKITLQIVGDKELYGDGYIIEPGAAGTSVTPNPAYKGPDPVVVKVQAAPTTIAVESAPIVQYVYSPVYVPYTPPYYYNYYPAYFAAFTVMAVGIYRHNNYYHHGYHHTTVIHNHNNFNNYNGDRNYSDRVQHNKAEGRYNNGNRASTQPSNRPGGGSSATRPSTQPSNRPGGGASASPRPSTQPSNKLSSGFSGSDRATTTPSNRSSGGGYSG